MKKLYIYLLALTFITACKKNNDNVTPVPVTPAAKTMVIKITGTQLFSYNVTEADTVTNDFDTKDGYDVTSLDLSFTPVVGHKILISGATKTTAPANALSVTVTYKGKALGPIVPVQGATNTYFSFTYVVPKS
ncbi:MAG: hypothetical protein V4619_14825 [Bacteroidota bacterium]